MKPVFIVRIESGHLYFMYENRTWSTNDIRDEEDKQWLPELGKCPTLWLWVPIVGANLLIYWYHPAKQTWMYRVTGIVDFVEVGHNDAI